jgi:hypothetical protein
MGIWTRGLDISINAKRARPDEQHDRTSGPSRGIEAEHSTDLSSTQGGDQAIKAGPFDSAARRATKIVAGSVLW